MRQPSCIGHIITNLTSQFAALDGCYSQATRGYMKACKHLSWSAASDMKTRNCFLRTFWLALETGTGWGSNLRCHTNAIYFPEILKIRLNVRSPRRLWQALLLLAHHACCQQPGKPLWGVTHQSQLQPKSSFGHLLRIHKRADAAGASLA